MMRAIVTGSAGQVARALAECGRTRSDLELTFLSRPEFDLTRAETLAQEIVRRSPDAVLSVAAYTDVETAETQTEKAMKINGEAPGILAKAACDANVPIVHLSTDYVFSGTGSKPYAEADAPAPVTEYGRSKLGGEQAIADANPKHVILRTAWVYSPYGKNFAKTMLGLAETRDRLNVVDDQYGNPTSAFDVADGLLRVLDVLAADKTSDGLFGVYHMVGAEEATWFSFAREIFRQSAMLGGPVAEVSPVDSSAFPSKANRPANSRLDCRKFGLRFGHELPGYGAALPRVVAALLDKPAETDSAS